jgi:hypothetical protein
VFPGKPTVTGDKTRNSQPPPANHYGYSFFFSHNANRRCHIPFPLNNGHDGFMLQVMLFTFGKKVSEEVDVPSLSFQLVFQDLVSPALMGKVN